MSRREYITTEPPLNPPEICEECGKAEAFRWIRDGNWQPYYLCHHCYLEFDTVRGEFLFEIEKERNR